MRYIDRCMRVCWQLILCEGSFSLKPKTFDFEVRSKQIHHDADIYDAHFGSHLSEQLNYVCFLFENEQGTGDMIQI